MTYEDDANLCECCGFVTDHELCLACEKAGCTMERMWCESGEHDDEWG